ncbi:hypothetical protein ACP3P8_27680 [Pseudomonas aeruginosa]
MAILMVAYVLSFIDRQILNLLVGPIRRDLAISDTEMSLLMGLSFALFYTLAVSRSDAWPTTAAGAA